MGFDIAVAHQATYYNPLLDMPFYWLAQHTPSWFALGFLGAVQGSNVVPLYLICRSLLQIEERRLAAAALTALCMTGGLTLSLAGTTYYDNIMSMFVLTGLAILVTQRETTGIWIAAAGGNAVGGGRTDCRQRGRPQIAGGALCTGLCRRPGDHSGQLETTRRAPGGGRRGRHRRRRAVRRLLVLAHGCGDRQSAVSLFQRYLPLAAGAGHILSRHPLPAAGLAGMRLLDPILFSIDCRVANDLPFTDIRVGLAYVLLLATGLVWLLRRHSRDPLVAPGGAALLFAFTAVTYLSWLAVFGIYRYILTLEMLAPIVIVAAVGLWPMSRYARLAVLGVLAVAVHGDNAGRFPGARAAGRSLCAGRICRRFPIPTTPWC